MPVIKKSICIETVFTEEPFESRLRPAKEAGIEYIEFWTWEDKDIRNIKEQCDEYNLKIASFSGDKDYSMVNYGESQDYISYVRESMEKAKYLNCSNLVIHSNSLGEGGVVVNHYDNISSSKKFDTMFDVLKSLAEICEVEKINLLLEALNTKIDHRGNFLAYTKDSAEVVRKVNSRYINVLYDIYHMQIMEGNIINTINEYKDVIGYIHIADVPGRHEPGTGEINFANVMNALKAADYKGFVGFELFPCVNSQKAIQAIKCL